DLPMFQLLHHFLYLKFHLMFLQSFRKPPNYLFKTAWILSSIILKPFLSPSSSIIIGGKNLNTSSFGPNDSISNHLLKAASQMFPAIPSSPQSTPCRSEERRV